MVRTLIYAVSGNSVLTPETAGVFFCACGIYPAVGLVLSWPAINVGGQTKRAVANALQISIGNLGAVSFTT